MHTEPLLDNGLLSITVEYCSMQQTQATVWTDYTYKVNYRSSTTVRLREQQELLKT